MKIQIIIVVIAALLATSSLVIFQNQGTFGTAQVPQTSLPSHQVAMRPPSRALGELKSLEEIQSIVDFRIKVPSNLPEGTRFKGAFQSTLPEVVQGKSGPYNVSAVTLVYWDKDVTPQTTHRDVLSGGGFFVIEAHVPGSTLEDFKIPRPQRIENNKPVGEVQYYPLSELWGYPANEGQSSVEVLDIKNAIVYGVSSDSLSKEVLLSVLESLIKG